MFKQKCFFVLFFEFLTWKSELIELSGLRVNMDINLEFHLITVMQKAWRERNPQARIRAAYQAIEMNQE